MGYSGLWFFLEAELIEKYSDDFLQQKGLSRLIIDAEFIMYVQHKMLEELSNEVKQLRIEVSELKSGMK